MSDPTPMRVLLADDDSVARGLIYDILELRGYDVVAQVGNGRDAVEQVDLLRPDLALLDVEMPEESGIDAARRISVAHPETAVVLLTGHEDITLTSEQRRTSGAFSMIAKPVRANTLDDALRLAIERTRDIAQARRETSEARLKLDERKLIERAKGILMRRTGSTEEGAYRIMQRASQDRATPMVEIAKAILDSEPGLGGSAR